MKRTEGHTLSSPTILVATIKKPENMITDASAYQQGGLLLQLGVLSHLEKNK